MGARIQAPNRNRVVVPARQATPAGGIDSLELVPGLLKSLKIRIQKIFRNSGYFNLPMNAMGDKK
jgi:hypothetical protein